MKQLFKQSLLGLLAVPVLAASAAVALPSLTHAVTCDDNDISVQSGAKCAQGKGTKNNLVGGQNSLVKIISDVLLFVLGAIAVIMIIIGGIRYVISNGDSSQISSAKNTIMYSVIGLIVALLAYAIVNFITGSFANDTSANGNGGTGATN